MLQSDLQGLGRVYRHTQRATIILWAFAGGAALDVVMIVLIARVAPPATLLIPGLAGLILLVCALLFHSLSVEVTRTRVRLWFGPGWIHKSFPTSQIREARVVRNHWWYGWGIRWTPHGWLFNISGLDAVEIRLRNDKQYRIGTDQPLELAEAIRSVCGAG